MRTSVFCALAVATLIGNAWAEQPERVLPEAVMSIGIGRSETLRFKSAFDSISVNSQGVVQAMAQSDHVLTLLGQAEGEAVVTVRQGGQELYTVAVQVTAEPGHVVKVYGRRDIQDYTGFYCTESGCGRADKELGVSREPTRSEQTVIHREGGRRD